MSFLTQSHQVFFGHRLCLIPSTAHVIQRLTQSLSSFRWTVPNHLNLLLLIIKLTGSNPKSSLEFFTFLPLIQLNPTHPSDHTHFNAVHLQFMLNFQFLFFSKIYVNNDHLPFIIIWDGEITQNSGCEFVSGSLTMRVRFCSSSQYLPVFLFGSSSVNEGFGFFIDGMERCFRGHLLRINCNCKYQLIDWTQRS